MNRWAKGFLLLGLILAALAVLPAALQLTIFPELSPVFAALALFSIGPIAVLGLLLAGVAYILWLAQR